MSTPAANKRRRVDAANVTLRKPFHSPVIRRPADAAGSSKTSEQQSTTPAIDGDAYSPSSPSLLPANRSLDALRPTPARRPASPLKFKTPIQRSGVKRKAPPSVGDGEESDHPGAAILALVGAHRHITQDEVLKDLERKLEMVRQAKGIEEASERERPGLPVDQALRELVETWKGASRMAADEVFEVVRERVANSGGPKAWKEMRKRQLDFYQGWDQDEAQKKPSRDDGNGDGEGFEEELEGDDGGGGAAEEQAAQAKKEADEAEEEEDEPEFNMAQMLQSLNIDLALLGYDEVEEKWID